MKKFLLAVATILITIGSGCAETRYVTVPLPLPARPVLPAVESAELDCISDEAYRKLVERDRMRRHYAEELESIIISTHEQDD